MNVLMRSTEYSEQWHFLLTASFLLFIPSNNICVNQHPWKLFAFFRKQSSSSRAKVFKILFTETNQAKSLVLPFAEKLSKRFCSSCSKPNFQIRNSWKGPAADVQASEIWCKEQAILQQFTHIASDLQGLA